MRCNWKSIIVSLLHPEDHIEASSGLKKRRVFCEKESHPEAIWPKAA